MAGVPASAAQRVGHASARQRHGGKETAAALSEAAAALPTPLSAETLRQAKHNHSQAAAPLWVALHDLLLAEELRRRRCRRRLGQPLRSDTVSRTTTADLETQRFVQTEFHALGYPQPVLFAHDVALIGSRDLLLALGWLLERLGTLEPAVAATSAHAELGAMASALSEQDLSRSPAIAARAAAATRLDVRVQPISVASAAGEALLACRQTHATAGQCLQAARANAALAAARSDVLAQMQARAERNSNLPATPAEAHLLAAESELRSGTKLLGQMADNLENSAERRLLWWRWLQSVVAKAESAAEEGAAKDGRIAATALLAALDAVDSVLDTEEGSYRVTANADCAMVEPLRLPPYVGAGDALELHFALQDHGGASRDRQPRHGHLSGVAQLLDGLQPVLARLAQDVGESSAQLELHLEGVSGALRPAVARVDMV